MESRALLHCFDVRYIVQTLAAAVVLIGLALFGKGFADGSASRVAIGVAETVVFAFIVAGTLLPIRRLDEMYQRIHLIAIAGAFGVFGVAVTGVAFLAKAGVHVPPLGQWMWLFMVVAWGVGVLVVSRRYQ